MIEGPGQILGREFDENLDDFLRNLDGLKEKFEKNGHVSFEDKFSLFLPCTQRTMKISFNFIVRKCPGHGYDKPSFQMNAHWEEK